MKPNEQLNHLISLLIAKRDGKKIEINLTEHKDIDDEWWVLKEFPTYNNCLDCRIAPEPAQKEKVCEWCNTEVDSKTYHEPNCKAKCCYSRKLRDGTLLRIIDRPTPTPTYRPYDNSSEVPMVVRFKQKEEVTVYSLEKISKFGLHINGVSYGFKAAFKELLQTTNGRDWTPAGVEEGK